MTDWKVGDRVTLDPNVNGVVAFVGETAFQPGIWIGLILDEPKGKNNGTVQGKSYFNCKEKHGMFVKPEKIRKEGAAVQKSNILRPPTSIPRKPAQTNSKSGITPSASREKIKMTESKESLSSSTSSVSKSSTPRRTERSSPQQTPATRRTPQMKHELSKSKITPLKPKDSNPTTPDRSPPQSEETHRSVSQLQKQFSTNQSIDTPTNRSHMNESAELDYLRREVDDLGQKLETLRIKRQEDRLALKEFERTKIEIAKLVDYKDQMHEMNTNLQRKLQQAEKDATDAITARQDYQEKFQSLNEMTEMAVIDKETAEEQVQMLQADLEAAKDRIEELEIDLNILIEQRDKGIGQPVTVDENAPDSVQIKQLQQQNERLKETLLTLRDLTTSNKDELLRLTKEYEELKEKYNEINRKYELETHNLKKASETILQLQEEVTANSNSSRLIEDLTMRNTDLDDRCQRLQDQIDFFEECKAIEEELSKEMLDNEKRYLEDLALKDNEIHEIHSELKRAADRLRQFEAEISKYKQSTQALREEKQDLLDQMQILQDRLVKKNMDGEDDAVVGVNGIAIMQERVSAELAQTECQSVREHIEYMRAFLPDNYAKSDADAVIITVLLPRLAAKAQLLNRHLTSRFPLVPGGMRLEHVVKTHKAEQWAFVAHAHHLLAAVVTHLHRIRSILDHCSVERLARIATLQQDLAQHERQVDTFFDQLRHNRLDENSSLAPLEKLLSLCHTIYTAHMVGEKVDCVQFVTDSMTQLMANTGWMRLSLKRLNLFVTEQAGTTNPIIDLTSALMTEIEEIEQYCVRIKNQLPAQQIHTDDAHKKKNGGNLAIELNNEQMQLLQDTDAELAKAAQAIHGTCQATSHHISIMTDDADSVETSKVLEMLKTTVERCFDDATTAQNRTHAQIIAAALNHVQQNIKVFAANLHDGKYNVKPMNEDKSQEENDKVPLPPILERAHARKQDAVEAESLRWQLTKKEDQLKEMMKQLRAHKDDYSELRVRYELAEKRAADQGDKGSTQLEQYRQRIDDLYNDKKKMEAEHAKIVERLNNELDRVEQEAQELRDKQKATSRMQLRKAVQQHMPAASPSSPMSAIGPFAMTGELAYTNILLQETKDALEMSERLRWHQTGQEMYRKILSLPKLYVPKCQASLTVAHTAGLVDLDASMMARHDESSRLARQVDKITHEYGAQIRETKIVDFTKPYPERQLQKQLLNQRRLSLAIKELSAQLAATRQSNLLGNKAEFGNFANIIADQSAKRLLASIVVPSETEQGQEPVSKSVVVNYEQICAIHQALIT